MTVRAGALRHRVTIERKVSAQDATGALVESWEVVGTVWAEVVPMTARELVAAGRDFGEISHQVLIRYHPALAAPLSTAATRVVYGVRVRALFGSINQDERNRLITLMCKESG